MIKFLPEATRAKAMVRGKEASIFFNKKCIEILINSILDIYLGFHLRQGKMRGGLLIAVSW